jgi:hypothetical protein
VSTGDQYDHGKKNPDANCLQHVNKQKHPAGPETVRVKRIFFSKMVILPQCHATF